MSSTAPVRQDDPRARPAGAAADPGTRIPRASVTDVQRLADQAADILAKAREAALEPNARKTLRKFSLTEAAALIGVSTKTIQRGQKTGEFPAGERAPGNRLLFTLEEMHAMQDRLGLSPARDPATDKPVVLAIANFKGGVGKTSTTVHLAQYFALRGYRTLAIDLDAQASLTTLFGLLPDSEVPTEETALPFLEGSETTLPVRKTHWPRLDLIPANLSLYGAEFALANRQNTEAGFRFYRALSLGLEPLLPNYDIVVIDTPPSLSYVTMNALYAATGLLVPVPPAMMDFASANLFFSLLADILKTVDTAEGGKKVYDFLGLLISQYEPGNVIHQTIHDWVRAAFQNRVLLNSMGKSAALRVGPEMLTAYELTSTQANRRTLVRALEYLEGVNGEIERLVRAQWSSKTTPRLVARGANAAGGNGQ
jgi:chromosome partitioning protein